VSQPSTLHADEIFGRQLAPAGWRSSRPVLALVVELLPTIDDALTADLLEHLALALLDRDDEVRALRAVLSSALALSHAQNTEAIWLQAALARLRDEYRALRMQTLQAAA
jgi:hypothetical protein